MITFTPLPTDDVRALQDGGLDSYGNLPERAISDGHGQPCRHCLKEVPAGQDYLILAHRPFPRQQPYAETGPIFLCARHCEAGGGSAIPASLSMDHYIVKAYTEDNRILYGTGAVTETQAIPTRAAELLRDPKIAYVHVRSAANNCYSVRIDRQA